MSTPCGPTTWVVTGTTAPPARSSTAWPPGACAWTMCTPRTPRACRHARRCRPASSASATGRSTMVASERTSCPKAPAGDSAPRPPPTAGWHPCAISGCGRRRSARSPNATRRTTSTPASTSASTSAPGASRLLTRWRRLLATGCCATDIATTGSSTSTCGTLTPRTGHRPRSATRSMTSRSRRGLTRRSGPPTGCYPGPIRHRSWPGSAPATCGTATHANRTRPRRWMTCAVSSTATTPGSAMPTTRSVSCSTWSMFWDSPMTPR